MMGWNYRLVRHTAEQGQVWFEIHECYYNKDGTISAWTEDPCHPSGETVEELRSDLERMMQALDYPVIEVKHEPVKDRGCGND